MLIWVEAGGGLGLELLLLWWWPFGAGYVLWLNIWIELTALFTYSFTCPMDNLRILPDYL